MKLLSVYRLYTLGAVLPLSSDGVLQIEGTHFRGTSDEVGQTLCSMVIRLRHQTAELPTSRTSDGMIWDTPNAAGQGGGRHTAQIHGNLCGKCRVIGPDQRKS